jgi:hypothetical protein
MNWRTRDKIIEAMYKNEPLYIRDTGVKVSVDYFGTDTRDSLGFSGRKKDFDEYSKCHIQFDSPPNMKALKMCKTFHIKKNSHSNTMELDAHIDISKLSLTPYETKAARVLYEQAKAKKKK